MDSLSLKTTEEMVWMSKVGGFQVRPPSVDLLTATPLFCALPLLSIFASMLLTNSVPVGPNETQGSAARSKLPPEALVMPGTTTSVQLCPPSKLTPATIPWAQPRVQRSCCQTPTRWFGLVGSTAKRGSTCVPIKSTSSTLGM